MVNGVRSAYNKSFSDHKYQEFLDDIHKAYDHVPAFRIAESPVFVGPELRKDIFEACTEIADVIASPDFKEQSRGALMSHYEVPDEDDHTIFLQMDFGICEEPDGTLLPKLIEVQGFPSLYFYQDLVAKAYVKHFDVPDNYSHLFGGLDSEGYIDLLRNVIVGNEKPENVVLLEIEPKSQVTQIDYYGTSHHLGIKTLCISDLKKEGRDLYYVNGTGKKTPVHRIYNRVIFDELVGRKDLQREFFFHEEINASWAGHPNWFFRISKYTLPFLKSRYVPRTYFLDKIEEIPEDLDNYVLKPLYSFSGSGVIFNVTPKHIEAIEDRSNFILQEKVTYSPVIDTPDDPVKCEIRMLMIWEPGRSYPKIVNNLARLSKGQMIGVRYNKNKTWVGGSVAFFERD